MTICILLYYYESQITSIKEELPYILKQSLTTAIEQDMDMRFKEGNIRHSVGHFKRNPDDPPLKGYTIMSKDTIEFIPADSAQIEDEALLENSERQTILNLFKPIRPQCIDSFFQAELVKQQIQAKSLIVLILGNKDIFYSNADTTLLSSALHTEPVILGLKKEIQLQAFVCVPELRNLKITRGILIGGLCCIAGFVLVETILTRKNSFMQKNKKARKNKKKNNPKDTSTSTSSDFVYFPYRICKKTKFKNHCLYEYRGASFDFYPLELYVNEVKTTMTPQSRKILLLLLESEDCFLNRKQLISRLWPGKTSNYNKLNKSVSRLREALAQADPSVGIRTYFKNGYQIDIDEEAIEKKNKTGIKDLVIPASGEKDKEGQESE